MTFSPLPQDDLEHVLEHTRPLWEGLRGGRIFVTGATGFFGLWLLESFALANEHLGLHAGLVGLSRDPAAFSRKAPHLAKHPSIRVHKGDVRNFDFPEGKFTHVIHAGTTSGAPVPPLEMLDTIIQGTRHTLDFSVAAGVQKFLFVSSGAVYGSQPPEITHLPETFMGGPDTMKPSSAYGEGKRVGELLCSLYHHQHGLETTIARCFAFVGPHLPLDAHFAVGNFIRDAMKGGPIMVKNGTPFRSYLYAADLAIWLWTILFKGKSCHPYNVGSDQEITIADLARQVACAIQGAGLTSSASPTTTVSTSYPSRYVPDTGRIKSELKLEKTFELVDSLRKTMQFISLNKIKAQI